MKKEEFLALLSAAAHDLAEFVIAQHPELFEAPSQPPPLGEGLDTEKTISEAPSTPPNGGSWRGAATQSTEATAAADEEPPQVAPRQRRARFPFAGW